jgi:hypothetical protein
VISGGDEGAQIAALKAARSLGIKTGGNTYKDFMMVNGKCCPGYRWMYGLKGTSVDRLSHYRDNFEQSDATIYFGIDFSSYKASIIRELYQGQHIKPLLDVYMEQTWYTDDEHGEFECRVSPKEIAYWIVINQVRTLNITGIINRDYESSIFLLLQEALNLLVWE